MSESKMWRALRSATCMALLLGACSGCGRMRFVVDAVPAVDALEETVVFSDENLGWSPAKVAIVDLDGLIIDANRPGLLAPGENPVSRFSESLHKAREDQRVSAVIVRINSPGGTVTASDVLHREIVHFKEETRKPVVVLMGDVAASGGYYVACAGDAIIAHPTTITGSIGVIMQTFNFADGLNRIGIHGDAITSGPNKDLANPFEEAEPEHREILQNLVEEFYQKFIAIVQAARPTIRTGEIARLTDGRIVSGQHAAASGLIDRTGDLYDAFDTAKMLAGIDSAALVKYHRPIEYVGSPYAASPAASAGSLQQVNLLQLNIDINPLANQPGFYYLWMPSAQ